MSRDDMSESDPWKEILSVLQWHYGTVKWWPWVDGPGDEIVVLKCSVWTIDGLSISAIHMDMSGNIYHIHIWKDLARWYLILMIFDSASILMRSVCLNRRESFLADLGSSTLAARYFGPGCNELRSNQRKLYPIPTSILLADLMQPGPVSISNKTPLSNDLAKSQNCTIGNSTYHITLKFHRCLSSSITVSLWHACQISEWLHACITRHKLILLDLTNTMRYYTDPAWLSLTNERKFVD